MIDKNVILVLHLYLDQWQLLPMICFENIIEVILSWLLNNLMVNKALWLFFSHISTQKGMIYVRNLCFSFYTLFIYIHTFFFLNSGRV